MQTYRIYIVGADGRLHLGLAFEAEDDEVAGRRAEAAAHRGEAAELWSGGRLVGRVSKRGTFTPRSS